MICPNCQNETPVTESRTCVHCGAVLNTSTASQPETPIRQTKKSKAGIISAIIIIAIVIISNLIPKGPSGVTKFETELEDGVISTYEFTYKNDVISKIVEDAVIAIPEGFSETDVDLIIAQLELEFTDIKALSFCSVDVKSTDESIVATITYNDLDNKDNLKKINDLGGYIEMDGEGDYLSYEKTEKNMLDDGYKKVS